MLTLAFYLNMILKMDLLIRDMKYNIFLCFYFLVPDWFYIIVFILGKVKNKLLAVLFFQKVIQVYSKFIAFPLKLSMSNFLLKPFLLKVASNILYIICTKLYWTPALPEGVLSNHPWGQCVGVCVGVCVCVSVFKYLSVSSLVFSETLHEVGGQ